jgi:hypothetical protein
MNNKFKRVKVVTEKGDRFITFKPVDLKDNLEELVCEKNCPYSKICDKIPDPRNMNDKNLKFLDFCGEAEDERDNTSLGNMVPLEGTVEEFFKDYPDIFQILIKNNTMVGIKDIIHRVCSGWCENYNKEMTNCKSTNSICWLQDLFINHISNEDNDKQGENINKEVESNE